jgi:hypothetical protein
MVRNNKKPYMRLHAFQVRGQTFCIHQSYPRAFQPRVYEDLAYWRVSQCRHKVSYAVYLTAAGDAYVGKPADTHAKPVQKVIPVDAAGTAWTKMKDAWPWMGTAPKT